MDAIFIEQIGEMCVKTSDRATNERTGKETNANRDENGEKDEDEDEKENENEERTTDEDSSGEEVGGRVEGEGERPPIQGPTRPVGMECRYESSRRLYSCLLTS